MGEREKKWKGEEKEEMHLTFLPSLSPIKLRPGPNRLTFVLTNV